VPHATPLPGDVIAPSSSTTNESRLRHIERLFAHLPTPDKLARDCPANLRQTFAAGRLAQIGTWFLALAREWERAG
jgi:hypothetical protein